VVHSASGSNDPGRIGNVLERIGGAEVTSSSMEEAGKKTDGVGNKEVDAGFRKIGVGGRATGKDIRLSNRIGGKRTREDESMTVLAESIGKARTRIAGVPKAGDGTGTERKENGPKIGEMKGGNGRNKDAIRSKKGPEGKGQPSSMGGRSLITSRTGWIARTVNATNGKTRREARESTSADSLKEIVWKIEIKGEESIEGTRTKNAARGRMSKSGEKEAVRGNGNSKATFEDKLVIKTSLTAMIMMIEQKGRIDFEVNENVAGASRALVHLTTRD
jgi:hypothetical protein